MSRTMRRWLVIAPLLVAALWLLLLRTPQKDPAPPVSTTPQASPTRAVADEPLRPSLQPPASTAARPQTSTTVIVTAEPEKPEPTAPSEVLAPAFPTIQLPKLPPPEAQGPVRALKARFGSESASASSQLHEQQLMATIQRTGPPPDMIDDVVCRRTLCRISARWRADRVIPFYQALGVLRRDHDPNLGIDSAGPPDANQAHRVELYIDLASTRPPMP
jgi:hypothetical protein